MYKRDATMQIQLKNVFGFPLRINHLDLDVVMHDLDGVDNWLLGTYARSRDVPLLTDYIVDGMTLDLAIPPLQWETICGWHFGHSAFTLCPASEVSCRRCAVAA